MGFAAADPVRTVAEGKRITLTVELEGGVEATRTESVPALLAAPAAFPGLHARRLR